jgi:hypothetical protein
MNWKRLLAYITGSVDQKILLRNEYLLAEMGGWRVTRNHWCESESPLRPPVGSRFSFIDGGRVRRNLLQFIEAGVLATDRLNQILERHHLLEKWQKFGDRFLKKERADGCNKFWTANVPCERDWPRSRSVRSWHFWKGCASAVIRFLRAGSDDTPPRKAQLAR